MKKSKIYLLSGIGAVVVLVAGVSVWAYQSNGESEGETVYKEVTVEKGNLTVGVTESGSVTIGTLDQELALESTTSTTASGQTGTAGMQTGTSGSTSSSSTSESLEVEEIYVSVGQTVAEGDPLLKISAESAAEYREALEEAVQEASTAVSEANLNAEKQKLEANYSYSLSVAEGSVAEANYLATIENLQEAVDEAQQAVDESASLINYFQEQINAGVDLSASLAEEQENYNELCTKLQSAKNNYTTKSIEAEETYQRAILSSNNANSQYSVDVSGADNDIEDAQDTLSDAKEALEEFDACVGEDGVIYAEYAGTIMELGYEAGDVLSSDTSIASFADTDSVTMTVSVSEEDITQIAVGDEVNIELTAYEDQIFTGEVLGMDTSTSSGSSTVSYEVTVAFTGDVTGIYMDMTGNVTFIQKQVEDVLYVSNKEIINEGTASYVKVKDSDGTIRKVQVETGFSDGVNVEITSGVSEGETVLIESQVRAE